MLDLYSANQTFIGLSVIIISRAIYFHFAKKKLSDILVRSNWNRALYAAMFA